MMQNKYGAWRFAPLAAAALIAVVPGSASAQERRPASPAQFEAARAAFLADLRRGASAREAAVDARGALEIGLGAQLFSDKNLSLRRNQSCASCHQPTPARDPKTGKPLAAPGFVDADNVEHGTPVSEGSVLGRFGSLEAPSDAYAAFSPPFHWDSEEEVYVGGQFWNGRSSTLADQAGQPLLNPVEMAMPSKAAVVDRLKANASYRQLFWFVYGLKIDRSLSATEIEAVYGAMTRAIGAFERSRPFAKFNSKFDYFMIGSTKLTAQELQGLELFNGKARCGGCHISTPTKSADGTWTPALFTDFTYDNIGVPRNLDIPGNPAPDKGLGGRPDIAAADPQGREIGKQKVMPLRNIAVTPPYAHNGVFKTLEQITHFYNTRDTLGHVADNRSPRFGVTGWPAPEIPQNVNKNELGNLRLTAREEAALVAFMKTLTDDYPSWGHDPEVPPGSPSPYGR
ncbi:cytochrome-c peroxidase [Methylosinus sp. Sm6]|uniref:cytochrome-c peroxidase n=1 Tax=Methylosinus sp. Sm6 TaxID=2866948 RepID=UPI001C99E13E|nr:cytochrome c peroxidase [Methylosinus sp. Sm6]MBY6243963.1 methylamine utilization protein MauG [Methylosinus sp. Sm6]